MCCAWSDARVLGDVGCRQFVIEASVIEGTQYDDTSCADRMSEDGLTGEGAVTRVPSPSPLNWKLETERKESNRNNRLLPVVFDGILIYTMNSLNLSPQTYHKVTKVEEANAHPAEHETLHPCISNSADTAVRNDCVL